jgi:hypothetical protein
VGYTTLVPNFIKFIDRFTKDVTKQTKFTTSSTQQLISSFVQKKFPSHLQYIRACLKSKGFSEHSVKYTHSHGENLLPSNMILFGRSGLFGVIKGKSIPHIHLKMKY